MGDEGVRRVALIGSTGSIGRQTVDVLASMPESFRVVALAAGRNTDLLAEQARLLKPELVAVAADADTSGLDLPTGTTLLRGDEPLEALATRADVDLVVVGTGGPSRS